MEDARQIPLLENNVIHVWTARFSDLDCYFRIFSDFLSQTEQEKASTFRKPAGARNYILRHGMVRYVLGTYTRTEPGMVPLVIAGNGKPELDLKRESLKISFNISHTSELVSVGVITKFGIGIDIVKIDPRCPIQEIAEYLFTPHEKKYLQGLQPDRRVSIFFTMWAMKEAIVKATGEGLPVIHDTDVLNILQYPPSGLPRYDKTNKGAADFFVCPFIPETGYRGAVAVRGEGEKPEFSCRG